MKKKGESGCKNRKKRPGKRPVNMIIAGTITYQNQRKLLQNKPKCWKKWLKRPI